MCQTLPKLFTICEYCPIIIYYHVSILVVKEEVKKGKKIGLSVKKTGLEGVTGYESIAKDRPTPVHIWGVCRNSCGTVSTTYGGFVQGIACDPRVGSVGPLGFIYGAWCVDLLRIIWIVNG